MWENSVGTFAEKQASETNTEYFGPQRESILFALLHQNHVAGKLKTLGKQASEANTDFVASSKHERLQQSILTALKFIDWDQDASESETLILTELRKSNSRAKLHLDEKQRRTWEMF